MSRRDFYRAVARRIPRLAVGVVIFGTGLAFQVEADLGLSPWDVLHQGIEGRSPLSFGTASILVSGLVLLLWFPLRQRIGLGTVINAIGVGLSTDVALWLIGDVTNLAARWGFLLGGVVMVGVGSGFYIGVRLGPGPRDGVMTGLAERGLSIRLARFLLEVNVLFIGWLLGGTVGVGTVVFAVLIGPLVQFSLKRLDLGEIPRPERKVGGAKRVGSGGVR